jgi:hypothetical protein
MEPISAAACLQQHRRVDAIEGRRLLSAQTATISESLVSSPYRARTL